MNNLRTVYFSAVLMLLSSSGVAHAAVFPDVPDGHMFQASIEALVDAQVINGNPDGTFQPDAPVNRAAMLKMLYEAQGKVPDPLSVRCFPDVEIGSWYEPYVCDAAAMKYVAGYADGTFRPDTPVNRVEALKMITQLFNIPVDEISDVNRGIIKFVDVSTSAWYTQYLITAYVTGILPIPGQDPSRFSPDKQLTRGEAAAYIHNALRVELNQDRQQTERSSSSIPGSSSSSAVSSVQSSSASSVEDEPQDATMNVTFPFEHDGKFTQKKTQSYFFDVSSDHTVSIAAHMQSGQPGQVVCRLYLQDESGFSDEYYLGYQEGTSCFIQAALSAGEYQLQVFPTVKDTTYTVKAESKNGDGNDGFSEAVTLSVNGKRDAVLTAIDLEDWYTFSVGSQQKMTVTLSNAPELRCIVYAMNDVDLASFTGPQCNQSYTFTPGTYYIAVGRKAPKGAQQSYSIILEK